MNLATLLVFSFMHPGHGHTDPGSWTHYLTEPVHVIPLAFGAIVVVTGGWLGAKWLARVRR